MIANLLVKAAASRKIVNIVRIYQSRKNKLARHRKLYTFTNEVEAKKQKHKSDTNDSN